MPIFSRPLPSIMVLQIIMMFCCIINFDIMRNLKESLLVTRLGAEAIPFVKLWVVVPSAFLFLITYSYLANHFNRRCLFIITLIPFLLWMPLFSVVIYPNLDSYALDQLSDSIRTLLPESLQLVAELIRYWPLTLFFALAEIWGSAVLCVLFWTSVNDLHNTHSATLHYPIITTIGNSASLISGPLMFYCVSRNSSMGQEGWEMSLLLICSVFTGLGLVILLIHDYCSRLKQTLNSDNSEESGTKTATQMPLLESVRYLAHSPYLGCIALMMFSYCVAMNLIEVAWKSKLVQIYTSEAEYSLFMGKLTLMLGLSCLICGFLTTRLLRKSWQTAALATPMIMALTSAPFFILVLMSGSETVWSSYPTINLLSVAVIAGLLNNVLSKSAKYTLFDSTKEMTFIPLNDEQKYKGKAAIELVVSRLGKSGSALFQQTLILFFGSLSLAMPWLAGAFVAAILLWIFSIKQLNHYYLRKQQQCLTDK